MSVDFDDFSYHKRGRGGRNMCVEEVAWHWDVAQFRRGYIERGITEPQVYRVKWKANKPLLRLVDEPPSWTLDRPPRDWNSLVELEPVPWPIYGTRWFFRCGGCGERCSKLFAPVIGSPPQCRICHELSYESRQVWDNVKRRGRLPGVFGRMMAAAQRGEEPAKELERYLRR